MILAAFAQDIELKEKAPAKKEPFRSYLVGIVRLISFGLLTRPLIMLR